MNWFRQSTGGTGAQFMRQAALWLCLGLLALISIAQVAHYHKDAVDADNCAICVVLQHVAPIVVAAVVVVFAAIGRVAPLVQMPVRTQRSASAHFIRPPPIG